VDWIVDPADEATTDQALTQLAEHLERHAADAGMVGAARRAVEQALADRPAEFGDGTVRLHLDWTGARACAELAEGPDPDVLAGLHLHPGDLVPAEQAPLLGDPTDGPVAQVPLAVERWVPDTYDDGPVPLVASPENVPHLDLSLSLPRESSSVPVVRKLSVQALTAFGVIHEDVADVELAITEACANVIDHAADTDTYEVQVELASDECAITVLDQGSGFDAAGVDENAPDHSETGRGLALMRALVDNVAFRSEPRAGAVVHMVKALSYDHNHPLWQRAAQAGTYEELRSED
jgi:serine/threonine-protein kinase RsbW